MKKPPRKSSKSTRSGPKPDPNRYPKGWNRKRVEEVIAHYENQTAEEAVAEDEAAYESNDSTMMQIPNRLVPKVEKLLARAG